MIRITRRYDSAWGAACVLDIVAGAVRITVTLDDPTRPMPVDAADLSLMEMIFAALLDRGAREERLHRRDAQYAVWAMAQHMKLSMGRVAELRPLGDLMLTAGSTRARSASVTVC